MSPGGESLPSWIPELVKILSVIVGGIVAYGLGRISVRDAAARKVVSDDVGLFLEQWVEFAKNLSTHQSGKPINESGTLTDSRIVLSDELQALKARRIRIENLLKSSDGVDLYEEFQKWWALSTGDKGIISEEIYAFTRVESRAAQISGDVFSIQIAQLRLKILRGKTGLRF